MIDKYAEIQNRILLYNACKGILRVKQADLADLAPKAWASTPDYLKPAINSAYNGAKNVGGFISSNPVSSIAGGLGGYMYGGRAGNYLAGGLAKAIGLNPAKKGIRGSIGRLIQGTGLWGGRALGTLGGALLLSNIVNGFNDKFKELNPTAPVKSTAPVKPAAPAAPAAVNTISDSGAM